MNIENKFDLIILGAGVAGLACGDYVLSNSKNAKILILEKNNFVGGLAATKKYKGFSYDLSPHRWFTKNKKLDKWIDELMGKELVWVKRNTPMYQFDNFFDYPIKFKNVLKNMNPAMSGFILITYIWGKIINIFSLRKTVKTMKDAYVSCFGWGLYRWFNKDYNEKLWGDGGCELMSADFVHQRVKNLSLKNLIFDALGLNRNKVVSLVEKFRYPVMGVGRISENLLKRIKKNRGMVNLNEEVIEIIKISNGYKIKTNKNIYTTKQIISSIPINIFLSSFDDKFFSKIKVQVKKLKFVSQKIVVLMINKKRLTPFTWIYVHPKKIKFFRFMEMSNWSKKMSPLNKTSLVFEYPYTKGDSIEKMKNKELVDLTINDFFKFFVKNKAKKSDILYKKVYDVPYAYPKYDLNYSKVLKKIYDFVEDNLDGIQLIGRNGMFHYNNLDHSVYTGILAAKNYLMKKNVYNLRKVNNEAEYLEEIKK